MKLEIELIPKNSFFTNLRSMLPTKDWDFVRRICYTEAGNKCEICGGVGREHPVECHEEWEYDWTTGIQRLKRLIALCPNCHAVKHAGFWTTVKNDKRKVMAQLMKVNEISESTAHRMLDAAFERWELMNRITWEIDITMVQEYLP